jgi:hypothetical protein
MTLRPRHVHRVTPDDVGRRVSVRRWLDEDHTEAGDVLGDLLAYADGRLTVDGRDGPVTFGEDTVLASRVVPPPPAPRRRR